MAAYVALLRAVNVGGTGKLPMSVLATLCTAAGFMQVKTYIASGNVVFRDDRSEALVNAALSRQLLEHAGKSIGVLVRDAAEMRDVVDRNPFPGEQGKQIAVLFTDEALPREPLDGARGLDGEQVRLGRRELFIFYP